MRPSILLMLGPLVVQPVAGEGAPARYSDTWHVGVAASNAKAGVKGYWTTREDLPVYIASPASLGHARPSGGFPVVIVAHHAVGVYHHPFLREFCDALAKEGYLAVLPDLFHRVWSEDVPTGLDMPFERMKIPAMLASQRDKDIIEDLKGSIALVHSNESLHANTQRVGVLGFCMGGRISWLAAVNTGMSKSVRAAVAYHGGNVWKAYPADEGESPEEQMAQLSCPVLGHFGEADGNPSLKDMARLQEKATAAGKTVEFHTYAGAKHGFSCRDSTNYQKEAAEASWAKTLEFLSRVLAAGPPPQRSDL